MTSQLISVREVFQRLDPERVARELEPALIEAMDRITRDVAERFQPGLWNALPEFVRKRLVQRVQAELPDLRSEEHTSELQSLMRISYAVFCLKKKKEL